MAILQLSLKDIGKQLDIRWLMLVDDDTLLRWDSIYRLIDRYEWGYFGLATSSEVQ